MKNDKILWIIRKCKNDEKSKKQYRIDEIIKLNGKI